MQFYAAKHILIRKKPYLCIENKRKQVLELDRQEVKRKVFKDNTKTIGKNKSKGQPRRFA